VRVAESSNSSSSFPVLRLRAYVWFAGFATILCALTGSKAAEPPTVKIVLVLSVGRGHTSNDLMESSLRAHVPWPVNFSIADIESPQFEDELYQKSKAEALRRGFGREKLDLVVVVSSRQLQFAVQYRDTMFPHVPIVFMSTNDPLDQEMLHGVTGVASASGSRETIDLALRLHPDTNAVAIITNESKAEEGFLRAEREELLRHQDRVREIDLVGSANSQMLDRVAALPPHTVVLFQLFPSDSNQPAFGALDVLAAVAQHLPTYSIFPALALDHGGIGGAYYDTTRDAVLAGQVAARVLSGERPEDVPVVHNSDLHPTADWRALRRWQIPESALPPGTLVL
jgi:ABC-type uncharacterized transport system substrate-binding protein